ncbi:MAG: cation:proton antiporter [Saprospirales bacterium]|nr:MAG: cation:proton antiporter [Saprospirales bacterium]
MEWLSTLAQEPFFEFAIILALAAILGGIGQLLKQPLIVMFIALGIIVGPGVLDVVQSEENIHLLAEIGIAILLFIVGLKLDLRLIKSTGKIALFTGLGQVLFTSVVGYAIGILLGFSPLHSFYIAVALTFSSTIIIVKLLSDKKEIDSLHGQIAIGFLIVQDIVVILVMIVLSAMGTGAETSVTEDVIRTILYSILLVVLTIVSMRFILPKVSFFLARSTELLSLFAIAWAIALAALSDYIGFSAEVGAFLAGVSLASSPFRDSIGTRLVSLRDFLLLFFFVHLGSNLDLSIIGQQIPAALLFSVFVLVGNPIIVLVIMGRMGYRKRTAFLAGLTVAQISEFSLIFAGLGLQIGHINEEIVGLITLVGLITIALSTYLILYSHQIYNYIHPLLSIFEKKDPFQDAKAKLKEKRNYDVVIIGLGRFGSKVASSLDHHPEISYMGVDFDPETIKKYQKKGKTILYGDIDDPDILEIIPYENAKLILSTIPNIDESMRFVRSLKREGYNGRVYLTAMQEKEVALLQKCGADEVLYPHKMAAENFYNYYIKKMDDLDTSY